MLGAALLSAGCVSVPTGPSTMALPGTGKAFDQFRADDGACRQYAYDAVGGHTARSAGRLGRASAVAGAAIGALIGGAVSGGHGAAVGAGVGGGAGGSRA